MFHKNNAIAINLFYSFDSRSVKKHTQAALNRKRKLAQTTAPKSMRLHDFLARKREKTKSSSAPGINKARMVTLPLTFISSISINKYIYVFEKNNFETSKVQSHSTL